MSEPFFSIIVPVYNGLSHDLPRCLNSIWEQDFFREKYEVICVDDCSTDETRKYLRQEEKIHGIIPIFNEVNMRQGGARNVGLKQARGRYILFIDQDDVFMPNVFTDIYNELQGNNIDVLVMDSIWQIAGKKEHNVLQHNFPCEDVMTGVEFIEKNSIPNSPWKFISRLSFIEDKKIYFPQDVLSGEDIDWSIRLMYAASSAKYCRKAVIRYYVNPASITRSMCFNKQGVYDLLDSANRLDMLNRTIFLNAPSAVRNVAMTRINSCRNNALKYYNMFYDDSVNKARKIREISGSVNGGVAEIAINNPMLYSILSNLVFPAGFLIMRLWIFIKYNRLWQIFF